jgi:Sec-independent protein secretion pathway component TatC
MEQIEIKKQIKKKYAMISLAQVMLILVIPTCLSVLSNQTLNQNWKITGLGLIGIGLIITFQTKNRLKRIHKNNI